MISGKRSLLVFFYLVKTLWGPMERSQFAFLDVYESLHEMLAAVRTKKNICTCVSVQSILYWLAGYEILEKYVYIF